MGYIIRRIKIWFINNIVVVINPKKHMKIYVNYLKKLGVHINGMPDNIDRSVYFDSTDFNLISIGDKVVISREVMLLTHDYSITNGLKAIDKPFWRNGAAVFLGNISIGDNSFIGAIASILPGTQIGKNCIIGAGCVVKGNIPDDSIVVGNPARIVANTKEWAEIKYEQKNYSYR